MRASFAVAIVVLASSSSRAHAHDTYVALIPNGTVFRCATCHFDSAGGGPRNGFGTAFAAAGRMYTAALAAMDSDLDGRTNAEELSGSPVTNPGSCDDVNQCAAGTDDCHALAYCSDMCPGFRCTCPSGYSGNGRTCTDVDECASWTDCAPGACVNTAGGFHCTCPTGYTASSDNRRCIRDGTCAAATDACWPGGRCVDTESGHRCECDPGHVEEADECVYRGCTIDPCGPSGTCAQISPTRHECLCGPGASGQLGRCASERPSHPMEQFFSWPECGGRLSLYTSSGATVCLSSGFPCQDIDAQRFVEHHEFLGPGTITCSCQAPPFPPDLRCSASPECESDCGQGFCTFDDDILSARCECYAGYVGRATCRTAAECDAGTIDCCGRGHVWDAASDACVDEDECASGAHRCGAGTCIDTDGGYQCSCPTGYVSDWYWTERWGFVRSCFDVNECASLSPCAGGGCVNDVGSYHCECRSGYRTSADGRSCADIDECAEGVPCGPGTCTNSFGSYWCECPSGYESRAGTCADIDECTNGTAVCDPGVPCSNELGGYRCGCSLGFREVSGACVDVDECASGMEACDDLAERCRNTEGGYSCECAPGFQRVGALCADIGECELALDDCGDNAECVDVAGGFVCTCRAGYVLRGTDCVPADPCADGTLLCTREHERCVVPVGGAAECACETGFMRDGSGSCRGVCGDGEIVEGEACDDGNTAAADGCSACAVEPGWRCFDEAGGSRCERTCGDGLVDEGEGCDDGEANSDVEPGACRTSCLRAHCGDGVVDDGERCDPGGGAGTPATACMLCGDEPDAGAPDGGIATMEGGCGCRASNEGGAPLALSILAPFLLLLRARRRTRARARAASGDRDSRAKSPSA